MMDSFMLLALTDALIITMIGLCWVLIYHWSGRAGVVGATLGVFVYYAVFYWSLV